MRALHITKYGRFPELVSKDIPTWLRGHNQVLIKMYYAPINPSDINFYQGLYGVRKTSFPIVGFQGSGIIQKADNQQLIGKKVSLFANMSNGTHATHIVSKMQDLIIWPDEADLKLIAMSIINPLSCIGLYNITKKQQVKRVVLSAAGSSLAKMMAKTIKNDKQSTVKSIIGLTRSRATDQQLLRIGFDNVLSTDLGSTQEQLLKNGQKTAFLDCIGGPFAGSVFNLLPQDSLAVCYGRLSKQRLGNIDIGEMYYKNKHIRGFWLNTWLKETKQQQIQRAKKLIVDNFEIYRQKYRTQYRLEDFMDAYRQSTRTQSLGKILLDLSK